MLRRTVIPGKLTSSRTLAFIGSGQMALAMATGVAKTDLFDRFIFCDPEPKAAVRCTESVKKVNKKLIVEATESWELCLASADNNVLAVKPDTASALLPDMAPKLKAQHLLISIMAGWTLGGLRELTGPHAKLIRCMPNTPLLVGLGATAIAADESATKLDVAMVEAMFSSCGYCTKVPESKMDAVTGVSGSGPAFVALIIEAMADAAVEQGLPRQTALQLAAQTVHGAGALCMDESRGGAGLHPAVVKDRVCSPSGTTIHGTAVLEKLGVRGTVMAAIRASAKRSMELAENP